MDKAMDFLKKNKIWVGIGCCVLGVIGLFMPFASISLLGYKETISFIEADGKFVMLCLIAAGVLIFLKKDKKLILIPLAIALLITIYDGINVSRVAGKYSYAEIKVSLGFFVTLIGTLAAGGVQFVKGDGENNNVVGSFSTPSFGQQNMMNQAQPQFGQQDMMNQAQPQFGQQNMMNQAQPQFGQQNMMNQAQPQFGQQNMMNQVQPQFGQQDMMNQVQPQFGQQDMMNQVQPQFGQQDMMNQAQPQFEQQNMMNQDPSSMNQPGNPNSF